jgi:serine phosphatase RsbU (regulator of sigma subunit)
MGLVGGGAFYLVIELFVLQPKIEARTLAAGDSEEAAQGFLQRALAFRGVEEVAHEFGNTVTRAFGDTRTLLLAPGTDGEVRILHGSGPPPATEIDDATPAFLWLGDRIEPLLRADLDELREFEGARATAALMDAFECDLLLPLVHRGLLLGLGLVKMTDPLTERSAGFFRAMRAYATVAVANTFLDAEARDEGQLASRFDLATAMQESLMPDDRPIRRKTYELRGLFRPVAECGGDLWHWRELADGKVLLVIADATGHGAAPALLAAVAKGSIDANWQMRLQNLDPGTLLSALNTAVHRTGRKRYMMTAFAAVVDTRGGVMHYANAGQNFPYFIHGPSSESPGKVEPLIARGNSLGAVSEAHFETHSRPMAHGDKLILYTDGIVEAGAPMSEPWGEKRFRAALTALAGQRVQRFTDLLMAEVEEFLGGREVADDVTMVAFQLGSGEEASA